MVRRAARDHEAAVGLDGHAAGEVVSGARETGDERSTREPRPTAVVRIVRDILVVATERGYLDAMSVVKVSELKNRLSHYLRQVRRGGSVLVCDRDRVIARIEPAGGSASGASDEAHWLDELERRGTIRRAAGKLPRGWLARRPKLKADLVAALLGERDEGR